MSNFNGNEAMKKHIDDLRERKKLSKLTIIYLNEQITFKKNLIESHKESLCEYEFIIDKLKCMLERNGFPYE